METWVIILIVVIVIVIIALVGGLLYYYFFVVSPTDPSGSGSGSGGTPTPSNNVKYGDTIRIFNTNADFGGYLTRCGPPSDPDTCSSTVTVIGPSGPDNNNLTSESSRWRLVSPTKSIGQDVLYGDDFRIELISNSLSLIICGSVTECGETIGLTETGIEWQFSKTSNNDTNSVITYGSLINIFTLNEENPLPPLSLCGNTNGCGTYATFRPDNNEQFKTWRIDRP